MTRKTDRPTSKRADRPERKGANLYDAQEKLSITGGDPEKHYVWVNDEGANVSKYLNADYQFEEDKDIALAYGATKTPSGTRIEQIVNKATGQKAVLMWIWKDWHEEDKKALGARVDEQEKGLYRTKGEEGMYGDIKVSN